MSKQDFLLEFGFRIAQEFAQAAPKDTAYLARSFPSTLRVEGDSIKFTLPDYAKFVVKGSAPHIIRPINSKALYWKGAQHPVKLVRHPGNKPNDFIKDVFHRKAFEILKKTINSYNK